MQKPSTKNINFTEIGPHRHCEEAHMCCIQVECIIVNVVSCSNNALNLHFLHFFAGQPLFVCVVFG